MSSNSQPQLQFTDPPPFFDGRPAILDRSYTRVERFSNKRPGGRKARSSLPAERQDSHDADEVDGEVDGEVENFDGRDEEEEPAEQPTAGPSSHIDAQQQDSDESAVSEDDEWEYEYEDLPPELVLLDIALPASQSAKLLQTSRNFSVVGLETNRPFLRVGNVTFMGRWEESVGTGIILENHKDATMPWPNQLLPCPLESPLPSMTHSHIYFQQAINLDSVDANSQARFEQARANLRLAEARNNASARETPADNEAESNSRMGVGGGDEDTDPVTAPDAEGQARPTRFLADDSHLSQNRASSLNTDSPDVEAGSSGSTPARGRGRQRGSRGKSRGVSRGGAVSNLGPMQRAQRAIERALLDDRPLTRKAQSYLAKYQKEKEEKEAAAAIEDSRAAAADDAAPPLAAPGSGQSQDDGGEEAPQEGLTGGDQGAAPSPDRDVDMAAPTEPGLGGQD
ncbi:unnamed protein product [Parajaminaea phylloscopi]